MASSRASASSSACSCTIRRRSTTASPTTRTTATITTRSACARSGPANTRASTARWSRVRRSATTRRRRRRDAAKRADEAFDAAVAKLQVLKDTADAGKMAYDQMIGPDNAEGNKIVDDVVRGPRCAGARGRRRGDGARPFASSSRARTASTIRRRFSRGGLPPKGAERRVFATISRRSLLRGAAALRRRRRSPTFGGSLGARVAAAGRAG